MLLAAQSHLGTKNCTAHMERYVYRRREDGIYVFNLGKTWEKLQMAARIIVAVENPQDVVCISARPYGQRGVLKFAGHTGSRSTVGRHTPGAEEMGEGESGGGAGRWMRGGRERPARWAEVNPSMPALAAAAAAVLTRHCPPRAQVPSPTRCRRALRSRACLL